MTDIENDLRGLRIMGAALNLGPVLFLLVAIYLRSDPEGAFVEPPEQVVLTWVSLFAGLALVMVSLLLPRPKARDIGAIRGDFIRRLAIVEGAALVAVVAYLIEGETFALGMALACVAANLGLHFPTRERVERLLRA